MSTFLPIVDTCCERFHEQSAFKLKPNPRAPRFQRKTLPPINTRPQVYSINDDVDDLLVMDDARAKLMVHKISQKLSLTVQTKHTKQT